MNDEDIAKDKISMAIAAINVARACSKMAGYGSEIRTALDEALKNVSYALDVAEGRK